MAQMSGAGMETRTWPLVSHDLREVGACDVQHARMRPWIWSQDVLITLTLLFTIPSAPIFPFHRGRLHPPPTLPP